MFLMADFLLFYIRFVVIKINNEALLSPAIFPHENQNNNINEWVGYVENINR